MLDAIQRPLKHNIYTHKSLSDINKTFRIVWQAIYAFYTSTLHIYLFLLSLHNDFFCLFNICLTCMC